MTARHPMDNDSETPTPAAGTPHPLSLAGRTDGRLCGAGPRRGRAHPCRNLAMRNGRCHLHGGKSTGPRTDAGRERCRQARTIHGERSAATMAERIVMSAFVRCVGDTSLDVDTRLARSLALLDELERVGRLADGDADA